MTSPLLEPAGERDSFKKCLVLFVTVGLGAPDAAPREGVLEEILSCLPSSHGETMGSGRI
jgi:hypothetical protein